MRRLLFLPAALPVLAAVGGIVTNGTTGKPQTGATVGLYKFGQGQDGPEPIFRGECGKPMEAAA